MPATYDEPKGVFLLEAMASGVPVVQPRRGAFTEIVEKTGGGLLVAPDDPAALADGLYQLWQDRSLRETLGERAFEGVRAHYSIAASADRMLEVYETVTRDMPTASAESPGSSEVELRRDVTRRHAARGNRSTIRDSAFSADDLRSRVP